MDYLMKKFECSIKKNSNTKTWKLDNDFEREGKGM